MSSSSHTIPTPYGLPPNTSFLFSITDVQPNYSVQRRQNDREGHWLPPDRWDAIVPPVSQTAQAPNPLYRWRNGKVTIVPPNSLAEARHLHTAENCRHLYGVSTVFTQKDDSHHFLCVPFDARRKNVKTTTPNRWMELGFDYDEHPRSENHVYSYATYAGQGSKLATSGDTTWNRNLFTALHIPDANSAEFPRNRNAGLTGELTLLLAIIAFSCPRESLSVVLQGCINLRRWTRHELTNGRTPERGVVVAVWRDPASQTTADTLGKLENGYYGAFFDP